METLFSIPAWVALCSWGAVAGMAVAATQSGSGQRSTSLHNKRIAILATDGFEQAELQEPKKALEEAGAKTAVIAPHAGTIRGWKEKDWGDPVRVDAALDQARAEDFDALVLPGGVLNPDQLRMDRKAVEFVKAFISAGKPVAAICHGPIMLIEAGVVRDRKLTSWPSLQTDLRNAGATWTDAEVVVDRNLITSRKPADIPAFNREMIKAFAGSGSKQQQEQRN